MSITLRQYVKKGDSMNKDKMKAKCEAWIKEGMGACRAPITYDELLGLIVELEQAKQEEK